MAMGAALQVIMEHDTPVRRLALARRHVETAMAHIDDVTEGVVRSASSGDAGLTDELRLIVRALADIRDALRSSGQHYSTGS